MTKILKALNQLGYNHSPIMQKFGELWYTNKKDIGVNVNPPKWSFFQETKFRHLGVLPRQIFTRPTTRNCTFSRTWGAGWPQVGLCPIFTARCTLVQSAVLRSHVVCLSVCPSIRPSVTLVDCDHICWNYSKIISPLVSLGCSLSADRNIRGVLQGEHPEIWAQIKVIRPLLI